MTHFYLVRHGVTTWIEKELLHGVSDVPLSEYGEKQAQLTAKTFEDIEVDQIYSSPLIRAMQTAEPISKITGVPIKEVPDLMEMNFGFMEGKRDWWPVIRGKKFFTFLYIKARLIGGFISGETFAAFRRRVSNAWDRIVKENPAGNVVIVAHSGVLRIIFTHVFGGDSVYNKKFIFSTGSVSEIEYDQQGKFQLVAINRNEHLPKDIDL